jgi:hypothetical protein
LETSAYFVYVTWNVVENTFEKSEAIDRQLEMALSRESAANCARSNLGR